MTIERIIAKDKELTQFKRFVLENSDLAVDYIVDYYKFELINLEAGETREMLISIGREARRYPHRVPKQ